jgi:hypothetical protein
VLPSAVPVVTPGVPATPALPAVAVPATGLPAAARMLLGLPL